MGKREKNNKQGPRKIDSESEKRKRVREPRAGDVDDMHTNTESGAIIDIEH